MRQECEIRMYLWLLHLLRLKPLTRDEINESYQTTSFYDGLPMSKKTLRNRLDVLERAFFCSISCDNQTRKYRAKWADDSYKENLALIEHVLWMEGITGWSTKIAHRIMLEPITGDPRLFSLIAKAMLLGRKLHVRYRKFQEEKDNERVVHPYFLRLDNQRWYFVGALDENPQECRTFSFDRIQELTMLDSTFVFPKGLTAENYFKGSYGVTVNEERPQKIVVRVNGRALDFIRTKPLCKDQKERRINNNSSIFTAYLRNTYELQNYLMTLVPMVEVLEPKALRNVIMQRCRMGLRVMGSEKKAVPSLG